MSLDMIGSKTTRRRVCEHGYLLLHTSHMRSAMSTTAVVILGCKCRSSNLAGSARVTQEHGHLLLRFPHVPDAQCLVHARCGEQAVIVLAPVAAQHLQHGSTGYRRPGPWAAHTAEAAQLQLLTQSANDNL